MHWWNLIKSACSCSQSHFECRADWSGAHWPCGGWFEQAYSLALNKIIFPVATTLRSVDILRGSRTGVNSTYIRNIVLIDHRAPKRRSTEKRERVGGAPLAGDGRNRWYKETIRGCTRQKKKNTQNTCALPCTLIWSIMTTSIGSHVWSYISFFILPLNRWQKEAPMWASLIHTYTARTWKIFSFIYYIRKRTWGLENI